jgi:hypothetical protein
MITLCCFSLHLPRSQAGADANAADDGGLCPLAMAAARGQRGLVQLLLPHTRQEGAKGLEGCKEWSSGGVMEAGEKLRERLQSSSQAAGAGASSERGAVWWGLGFGERVPRRPIQGGGRRQLVGAWLLPFSPTKPSFVAFCGVSPPLFSLFPVSSHLSSLTHVLSPVFSYLTLCSLSSFSGAAASSSQEVVAIPDPANPDEAKAAELKRAGDEVCVCVCVCVSVCVCVCLCVRVCV